MANTCASTDGLQFLHQLGGATREWFLIKRPVNAHFLLCESGPGVCVWHLVQTLNPPSSPPSVRRLQPLSSAGKVPAQSDAFSSPAAAGPGTPSLVLSLL